MRLSAILLFLSVSLACLSQSVTEILDSLVSQGNRAYELSQPSQIKRCADSACRILTSGALDGDALKDYTVSVLKLYGNCHYETADLDSANFYYTRAREIIISNPNTDFHGNALLLPREFAQLYYRQGKYADALAVLEPVYEDMEFNGRFDTEINSAERLRFMMSYAMCLARMRRFDEALSIAETELRDAAHRESLDFARAQRMYAKIRLLADAGRKGALAAYKAYFAAQKQDALRRFAEMTAQERTEYWHTLRPFMADCYLLEDEDPGFLYDVTLFSKGLLLQLSSLSGEGNSSEEALKTLSYGWRDIRSRLKSGDAAIEFIQYGDDDTPRMAALLLKPKGSPQFIPLTSPAEILSVAGHAIGSADRRDKDRLYSDSLLHAKVWTPALLSALKGVRRLYFAPDGYMHRLAIEYMPPVAHIDMRRLTSTRRLMEPSSELKSDAPMLAFGAVNYDIDKQKGDKTLNDATAFAQYRGKFFPRLAETSDETRAILAERANPLDTVVSGAGASEFMFRTLAPYYSSILLSTHGDFCSSLPLATDLKPVANDETLSSNIIAFSGVNPRLRDPAFDASDQCDGLLSALEVSAMDLSGCQLLTASACRTALGEITSDGVFGLQRGMKLAGVGTMLLSLWSVNSDATSLLMKTFYRNMEAGMPVGKAFREARRSLMDGIRDEETVTFVFDPATLASKAVKSPPRAFDTPQYTDAFILIDAID